LFVSIAALAGRKARKAIIQNYNRREFAVCRYLDPAAFMVYVFANSSDNINSHSLKTLRSLRDKVADSLEDQNVFIEWTRNGVLGAVECFPDIFEKEDAEIYWRGSDKDLAKRGFNNGFSKDFEKRLDDAIRQALES